MPVQDPYRRSAALYDRVYAFKDQAGVGQGVRAQLARRHPSATTLLDVACGTGSTLAGLDDVYEVVGSDVSADMLEIARGRLPHVALHQADMAALDLDRRFDIVLCLFSSIGYVVDVERLDMAVERLAAHLAPGGLLLVEPWFTPETYWTGHLVSHHADDDEVKLSWTYVAEREDKRSVHEIHYLLGRRTGVEHFTERHVMGLFSHEEYVQAFRRAGLTVEHEPEGFYGRGLYCGSWSASR